MAPLTGSGSSSSSCVGLRSIYSPYLDGTLSERLSGMESIDGLPSSPESDASVASPDYPPPIIAADIDILQACRRRENINRNSIQFSHSMSSPARRFSDVTFVRTLGSGSFGSVYLARNKASSELSAIKVVKKSEMSASSLKLILSEQATLRELTEIRHPFFLQLKESFHDTEYFYLVTEYLPGGDLGEMLKNAPGKKFDHTRVHLCMTEIVCGVMHLHSIGIIHRDIKPENIFIDVNGHLVIGDFGLATKVTIGNQYGAWDEHTDEVPDEMGVVVPHVRSGRTCGTPGFMAPELYLRKQHTFAADIWSIGVVMYLMIYGEMPFDGDSMRDLISVTLHKALNLRIFDNICGIVAMSLLRLLLSKDPLDRPSLHEMTLHDYFEGVDWSVVAKRRGRVDWQKFTPGPNSPTDSREEIPFVIPEGTPYTPRADPHREFTYKAIEYKIQLRTEISTSPNKPNVLVAGLCKVRSVFTIREKKARRKTMGVEGRGGKPDETKVLMRDIARLEMADDVTDNIDQELDSVRVAEDGIVYSSGGHLKPGSKGTSWATSSFNSRRTMKRPPSFIRVFLRDHEKGGSTENLVPRLLHHKPISSVRSNAERAPSSPLRRLRQSWMSESLTDRVEGSDTTPLINNRGPFLPFVTWGRRFRTRR